MIGLLRLRLFAFALVGLGFLPVGLAHDPVAVVGTSDRTERQVRAHYVVTVTDDFVVDVYHNGVQVPDEKRQLLEERFGATAERIDIEVRRGDWLVFHVVNNKMRWGGVRYFAAAGCYGPDEFGFVSDLSGAWSACDSLKEVDRFIERPGYLRHRAASAIEEPWGDGTPMMHAHAGPAWNGAPVWGSARSTWLKVVVE